MKARWTSTILCLFLVAGGPHGLPGHAQTAEDTGRVTTLFDFDWRFHRGGAQGAEMPAFDDSAWRKIDLPHDWSIENIPGTNSPFDPDAVGQVSTGFTVGGTGWYRKRFALPVGQKGKRLHIRFDGVYMNADVWVNGVHAGNHPYGYTGFRFDITDLVNQDGENVIAVQVKNEGQNSRWYSGSGIYRHVWLVTVSPLYLPDGGTYITTPEVSASAARVNIRTELYNAGAGAAHATLVTTVLDSRGVQVARVESNHTVPRGAAVDAAQQTVIPSPERWSTESPALYTAVSELRAAGRTLDKVITSFGVRTISFDTENGFRLNGLPIELKGGCVHHDNGPLGARAYDRAEERKVEILKANGYNAVRCAHNPPSPAFLPPPLAALLWARVAISCKAVHAS